MAEEKHFPLTGSGLEAATGEVEGLLLCGHLQPLTILGNFK